MGETKLCLGIRLNSVYNARLNDGKHQGAEPEHQ